MADPCSQERARGNSLFRQKQFKLAADAYEKAMKLAKGEQSLHDVAALNLVAALLKLHAYAAAKKQAHILVRNNPQNAKAHYRLGQAYQALYQPDQAQDAYNEAIKLDPSLREPRQSLLHLKQQLKDDSRFAQLCQDLSRVEARAYTSLQLAELPRARQQMELMLRDARAAKMTHFEVRALIGLALICVNEAENEGACDYLKAARTAITGVHDDVFAEILICHVSAVVALEEGKLQDAATHVAAGEALASETRDVCMLSRLLATRAAIYASNGSVDQALAVARDGIKFAYEGDDRHGAAMHALQMGHLLGKSGQGDLAYEWLRSGSDLAYGLAYSHPLHSAHSLIAQLQLQYGKSANRHSSAIEKFDKAFAISEKNKLCRDACDAAHNLFSTQLRTCSAPLTECVAGLQFAMSEARKISYTSGLIRSGLELALSFIGGPEPLKYSRYDSAIDVVRANATLEEVMPSASAMQQSRGLSISCLCHLRFGGPSKLPEALIDARRAKELAVAEGGSGAAAELTNLGITLLLAQCSEQGCDDDEVRAAHDPTLYAQSDMVMEARALFTDAIHMAKMAGSGSECVEARAHSSLSLLHELSGDFDGAYVSRCDALNLQERRMKSIGNVPDTFLRASCSGNALRDAGFCVEGLAQLCVAEEIVDYVLGV